MARSVCSQANQNGPEAFQYSTSRIAILKLDTTIPEPFLFPSETDPLHTGEPLIFEYDKELDCSQPFWFTVRIMVSEIERDFNKDNIIVVCEDRMIGVQFDGSNFDLSKLEGNTATITLSDVVDTSNNKGDSISTTVHFASVEREWQSKRKLSVVSASSRHAEKGSQHRLLTGVPTIKIFQKPLFPASMSNEGNGKVEESQLKGMEH